MSAPKRRRGQAFGYLVGFSASVLAHGLLLLVAREVGGLPRFDVEFRRPVEITLGFNDVPEPPAADVTPSPPPEPSAEPPSPPPPKAAPTPPPHDGPPPAVKPPAVPSAETQATQDEAPNAVIDDEGPYVDYAPKGAQVALRLDFSLIRHTVLAPKVEELLEAVPDWTAITGDSGIRSVDDLDQVYFASPSLTRSSVVVAGSYVEKGSDATMESLPRRIVQNLARARKLPAPWRTEGEFQIAPWHDRDPTERVVALVGPRQFVIAPRDDLDRVLQVARETAARKAEKEAAQPTGHDEEPAPPSTVDSDSAKESPQRPDAPPTAESAVASLLDPGASRIISVTVEGVELFVTGADPRIPERLIVAMGAVVDEHVELEGRGVYGDPRAAERAAAHWRVAIQQLASHPTMLMLGLRFPLLSARVETDDERVTIRLTLTAFLAQALLGTVTDLLRSASASSHSDVSREERPGGF